MATASIGRAAYSNLSLVRPVQKGAAARKQAARSEASAEAKLKAKVDQANRVLDALEQRRAESAKAAKAWKQRDASLAARIEAIEDAILAQLDEAGIEKVAGYRTALSSRLTPAALDIVDRTKIPADYWRQPETPAKEPDKTAIKKALAKNADLDPAAWGVRLTLRFSLVRE